VQYPHVFCFICPTHSLDNFLKNVCSDNATIRIKSVRTADDEQSFDWGSDVFAKPINDTWEVVKFITNHSKPLACFRELARDANTWRPGPPPRTVELVKYCDTRFASKLLMLERFLVLRPVLELLVANPGYKAWLAKQKTETKKEAEAIKRCVHSSEHWDAVAATLKFLLPVVRVLRLTDGKTGATLSKVYNLMSQLSTMFEQEVEGFDDRVRQKIWQLFMARWTYFHEPIFTAAYYLDPEFMKGRGSQQEEKDFRDVLKVVSAAEHCPYRLSDMLTQWASLQTALKVESHGLDAEQAFSPAGKAMPCFEWAAVYLFHWPAIQYLACRLPGLACSASGCEHRCALLMIID